MDEHCGDFTLRHVPPGTYNVDSEALFMTADNRDPSFARIGVSPTSPVVGDTDITAFKVTITPQGTATQ